MEPKNRLQDVSGTYNFRDVGGYAASGGATKWGELFRADALHSLSPKGIQQMRDIGVETVIDLRDDRERKYAPDVLPEGTNFIASPIFPDALSHIDRKLNIESLTELIFFEHPDTLTETVGTLATASGPTVVHCTAGKDRTGAVIALALLAVGVDRDDVLHDYALTEKNLAGEWLEGHVTKLKQLNREINDDILGLVSASPLPVMDRALKMIDNEFGSPTDYLINHGLSDAKIESLHGKLVS